MVQEQFSSAKDAKNAKESVWFAIENLWLLLV
jgi:hypothetical protein